MSLHERMMQSHGAGSGNPKGMPKDIISFEVTLESKRQIAEGTYAFTFEKPEGFRFKAGQHVRMSLINPTETDAEGSRRFLTIASTPQEADLTFAMRMRDTAFKRVLGRMQIGEKVHIDVMLHAQHKSFTLDDDSSKQAVFLIGGIGIVPVYAIIKDAIERKLPHKILLFYSNRRPEDAPFLDELHSMEKQNPNLKVIATMTEPERSAVAWQGEAGVINQAMLERYLDNLNAPIYYIAGLSGMVKAMKTLLADAGVSEDSIRAEDFGGLKMHIMTRLPITWKNRLPLIVTTVPVAIIIAVAMHIMVGTPTHTASHSANIFGLKSLVVHFVVISLIVLAFFRSGHLLKWGGKES